MTYAEAKRQATKKNAGVKFTGDAGNGWSFEVYYCQTRKRQVWTSINPAGMRVV